VNPHRTLVSPLLALALAGCSPNSAPSDPTHNTPTPPASSSTDSTRGTSAAPPTPAPLDWKFLEAPLLTDHVELTSRDKFVKAGEAYFDHNSPPRWVIFQAVSVPAPGAEPDPFYAMYVARLKYDQHGITGIDTPLRISPDGSANTCGWFDPVTKHHVVFGSTLVKPGNTQRPGFQVGTRNYVWMFPHEMEIVSRTVPDVFRDLQPGAPQPQWSGDAFAAKPLFSRPNYDAECSYSKNGRFVLYAHVRDEPTRGKDDADIWVFDTQTGEQHEIVHADGYDGGPFFSPDNTRICYRSDRKGDDLLQLFVADLKFDSKGMPVGIEREHQVTNNENVNWAPFWHPSGKFLIYGTSEVSHANYEVFAVEVPEASDSAKLAAQLRKRRITYANGADVLPVFSDDGKYMMWTGQRGKMAEGETKPSSQVWVARFDASNSLTARPDSLFLPRFDPLKTEKDAIAIAKRVIGDRANAAGFRVTRTQSHWSVLVNFLPATPGAHTTIEIDANGQVTDWSPGR
jgi:hypothetical protein